MWLVFAPTVHTSSLPTFVTATLPSCVRVCSRAINREIGWMCPDAINQPTTYLEIEQHHFLLAVLAVRLPDVGDDGRDDLCLRVINRSRGEERALLVEQPDIAIKVVSGVVSMVVERNSHTVTYMVATTSLEFACSKTFGRTFGRSMTSAGFEVLRRRASSEEIETRI